MTGKLPSHADLSDLQLEFGAAVKRAVPLSKLSHWRIGGLATALVRPRSLPELVRLRSWLAERGLAHVVLGATSNLLFDDKGLHAVGIQLGEPLRHIRVSEGQILAGAAAWVPGVAKTAMKAGLSGLEHICGIPGTLGGLIYMNGGSQRRGIGENTLLVKSVDGSGNLITRTGDECHFAYRTSTFQTETEIIAEVTLGNFGLRAKEHIRREMLGILQERRKKFPRKLPNCGSVFVSNPDMYAEFGPPGAVLERLGFKGRRSGSAQFSPQHANFINNLGGATASDVLALIHEAKQTVLESTGYELAVEARFVTASGEIYPAG